MSKEVELIEIKHKNKMEFENLKHEHLVEELGLMGKKKIAGYSR